MADEAKAVTLEALAERIGRLEEHVATQITPRFDDVQNEHKSLFGRIDLYFADLQKQLNTERVDLQKQLNETNVTLSAELHKLLAEAHNLLDEVRQKFHDRIQEEIRKVTADEIGESLTKKILITRQATREELNSPDTLKFRHATFDELHNRRN